VAHTTESTRRNLKDSRQQVNALTLENEEQARLREATEQECCTLQQELEDMQSAMAAMRQASAPLPKSKRQVTIQTAPPLFLYWNN
jgi:uncharacterized membrane protein